jgi:hypothetical protein
MYVEYAVAKGITDNCGKRVVEDAVLLHCFKNILVCQNGHKLFLLWPYYSGISPGNSWNIDNVFKVP